jgi:putative spermidine/putrescine transport system permease protein
LLDRALAILGIVYLALVYAFIFVPLALVVLISFSADSYLTFPPSGWSMQWYAELLGNREFVEAAGNSLIIAVAVTALSLVLGTPAAVAIARYRFLGRDVLQTVMLAPLLLPTIVLGLGILLVFFRLDLVATYPGLILAHLAITLPFAIRVLTTTLATLPPDIESAAATLGATPMQVFRYVTAPLMLPGAIASAALAFILSFDEIVISLFVVGPRLSTLPVEIYRYVDERTDPMVAAVSVVLIGLSILVVLLVERTIGFMRAVGR